MKTSFPLTIMPPTSEMIKRREATCSYHRMPIGYGPFPGPRQTWEGVTRLGTKAWTDTKRQGSTITFKSPKAFLETLLPHESFSFQTPGDEVYCSWAVLDLANLGWLEGRGYKTFGLYIHDVTCKGETETIVGDYLSVLYEDFSDPITSGREELGTAKIFCDIDETTTDSEYTVKLGWQGFNFCTMIIKDLTQVNINAEKPKTSYQPSQGILHYKYIPATGRPGFADCEYPCVTPFPPPAVGVTEKVVVGSSTSSSIKFDAAGWHELPTMHHIVAAFEKIKVLEIIDARITWVRGSGDLSNQRAVH